MPQEPLKLLGQANVQVCYEHQSVTLPILVVSGDGPSLFERNWLHAIRLNWGEIKKINVALDDLMERYGELFKDELGTVQDYCVKLVLKQNAKPRFFRPRAVPYAIKGTTEKDLDRLEKLGVITKVSRADWAAFIVCVPKADGSVRICGDYKVTINPELEIDHYPLPTPEDLFATLSGGKFFSQLDLSHAYQQVLLHEDCRKYVTINTHRGLYQYNRLPFGVASAPAVFQQLMETVLQGAKGVVCYLDDVMVTGKDEQDHFQNLDEVLRRLKQWGFRLKKSKCHLLQSSVEYLGFKVDADGLHKTAAKVEAILNTPQPIDARQLRSFLGLVHYYGRFVPDLATITQPLNELLQKNKKWNWSSDCSKAFSRLKEELSSPRVLAHYDVSLPLKLSCDASAYGVGAVIAHIMPDKSERPVAYASRTLSPAERNYAQIEKEALGIIFGVTKFHKFLYGRKFTLVTDHKPLLTLLGPKSQIPPLAAARLQRWALILTAYNYDTQYCPSDKHGNANGLSRLPVPCKHHCDMSPATLFNILQVNQLPVNPDRLKQAMAVDPVLSKVLRYVQGGWPQHVSPELKPFYQHKDELIIEAGCLMWGIRVVIPSKLRQQVMDEVHTSHAGIVRMKSLARIHVWWPSIDKDIEELSHGCEICQSMQNKPPPVLLHPWTWPTRAWQRIHVDFAGPFMGAMFFIIVDAHSKWVEVIQMSSTTSSKTITELRKLFSSYGLPDQLVSDNGPQFTSDEFSCFMKANGIKHILTSPYHPKSNGEAERFVQTLKNALRRERQESDSIHTKLSRFLMSYRTTPNTTTGVTPSELFLGRKVKTRLDILRPSLLNKVAGKQAVQKKYHDVHSDVRQFTVGQKVWVENTMPKATEAKWLSGTIVEKLGTVLYKVLVHNRGVWKRHADQIRPHLDRILPSSPCPDDVDMFAEFPTSEESSNERAGSSSELDTTSLDEQIPPTAAPEVLTQQPVPTLDPECGRRYPARVRTAPDRYDPTLS